MEGRHPQTARQPVVLSLETCRIHVWQTSFPLDDGSASEESSQHGSASRRRLYSANPCPTEEGERKRLADKYRETPSLLNRYLGLSCTELDLRGHNPGTTPYFKPISGVMKISGKPRQERI